MSRVSRRRSTRCSAGSASSRSAWTSPSDCWRRDESGDMARLLIIDDDVTLRQALTKHLEHAGHEVRQAADGDAGIRAYERHAADVVIVDIFMPGQGGLQTIGRLRHEWPAVKIVAMWGGTRWPWGPTASSRNRSRPPPWWRWSKRCSVKEERRPRSLERCGYGAG